MSKSANDDTFFFERFGLDEAGLERCLGTLLNGGVEDGDIYFESTYTGSASLDEGLVKRTSSDRRQGVGCRAVEGERTGYAYTDVIDSKQLQRTAKAANGIASESDRNRSLDLSKGGLDQDLYGVAEPSVIVPLGEQLELLQKINEAGRAVDSRIQNVLAGVTVQYKRVLIVKADGSWVSDVRPLIHLSVSCLAEEKGNRQTGRDGGGGRLPFSYFTHEDKWRSYVEEAARQAIVNLDSRPAPAGSQTVVLGPGWPGILLHEAVGHGLEGDFNRKGISAFSGKVGERVATEHCTVVDDGTIVDRRGSLNVDDEGTPTQRTVLIEKGILRGYLQDRLNGRLMGVGSSGNGRRQSYAHCPMPRMTNTYMESGEHAPEEIMRSVKNGIYAENFSGGQVDITSGRFVFSASEAYLIEDGKKTSPLRGVTLIGNGPDVLKRVSMVGNDMALDRGLGTCGKDGQSVPVGVGMPTIRIDDLTVGGTAG